MLDLTQVPAPRVPITDNATGLVAVEWFRFFTGLYTVVGANQNVIQPVNGGTGLSAIPTAGQLLIGTGTGYALNTLTPGVGLSVTNTPGVITLANTGVLSWSGGLTGLTPATATTGAVTLAGTLGAGYGGTGLASYAVGDLLYASGTTALSQLADVATGNALISGGVATAPAWGKIGLTTHVSGILPIANGGTNGTATPTLGGVAYGTGTALGYSATGSSGQFLTSAGGAAPTWTSATALAGAVGYYGAFHDTTTQTATSTTVAYVMAIGSVDLQNGVSIVSGTQITVANAGIYDLQFSAQFSNPNAAIADISVWIRINGVNVADGAGTNGVPAKHGSNNGLQIVSWNYVLSLAAGDYVELVWHSDATNVQLITIAATTGPAVPESPALIVTIAAQSQVGIGYYGQTSTTSTTIGTGSKTFTVGIPATSTAFTIGTRVRFAYTTTPANFMEGVITAFATTSMTVLVDLTGGSGTYATWAVSVAGNQGTGAVTSVTGTAPVVSSGGTTPAISMPVATTSVNGYLSSTDWTTFNAKQPAGTYVNSVSGTAGRVTSTGGVTPVIDLASGIATPGTTGSATLIPVVTIDTYGRVTGITTAANPQGTVTSVTGTSPVVSSGGATPAISMAAATSSVNGYLTSTDWSTFNNKGSGSVTSVSFTGGLITVATATTTPALTVAGTSGGIPYFSSASTWASSAALTQYGIVYGGGAGATPVATAAGTTGQILTATTSGAPTWSSTYAGTVTSVSVVSANGFAGTVATSTTTPAITLSTSITGVLYGNGTAIVAATISAPLSYSAGTLSIPVATSSANGYLSSTDWSTFNAKQPVAAPVTKTADFTVAATDIWLINNKAASTCTVTLPTASTYTGRKLTIKNLQAFTVVSASSNVVPIDSTSAGTAILLDVVGNWATLVSDGTNWVIMQQASNNNLLLE